MLSEKSKVQDNMLWEKYIFLFACTAQKSWIYKKLITMITCGIGWRVELVDRDMCEISQDIPCSILVFEPFEYITYSKPKLIYLKVSLVFSF